MGVAVLILGLAVALSPIGAMIANGVWGIGDEAVDRHLGMFLAGGIATMIAGAIVAVLGLSIIETSDRHRCERAGGTWVIDRYDIIYVQSGKVLVPIREPIHTCQTT